MENLENFQEDIKKRINWLKAKFENKLKGRLTTAFLETIIERLQTDWSVFLLNHKKILLNTNKIDLHNSYYYKNNVYDEVKQNFLALNFELKELLYAKKSTDIMPPESNYDHNNITNLCKIESLETIASLGPREDTHGEKFMNNEISITLPTPDIQQLSHSSINLANCNSQKNNIEEPSNVAVCQYILLEIVYSSMEFKKCTHKMIDFQNEDKDVSNGINLSLCKTYSPINNFGRSVFYSRKCLNLTSLNIIDDTRTKLFYKQIITVAINGWIKTYQKELNKTKIIIVKKYKRNFIIFYIFMYLYDIMKGSSSIHGAKWLMGKVKQKRCFYVLFVIFLLLL